MPTIHTENTDQLRSGHRLIEADGRCGQMSVEYDQVKLVAMGIKLHVMLLHCMFRNHTLLCIALHVNSHAVHVYTYIHHSVWMLMHLQDVDGYVIWYMTNVMVSYKL